MTQFDRLREFYHCLSEFTEISAMQAAMAGIAIALGFLLRGILSRLVIRLLATLGDRRNSLRESLVISLTKPVGLIILILSFYLAGIVMDLPRELEILYNRALNSLITFTFFWGTICLLNVISDQAHQKRFFGTKVSEEFYSFIFKTMNVIIWMLAGMTILELWNINVFAFVAGLGLAGMAVALAAQDTLKNIFGSLSILMDQTFKKGDWIKTATVEGVVEEIGFRTTAIRQKDKALVSIPNAKLADDAITNFSKMPYRLIEFKIEISYDTSLKKIQKVLEKMRHYLESLPEVVVDEEKAPLVVRLLEMGDSGYEISCFFFTTELSFVPYTRVKETALLGLNHIIEDMNVALPYPTYNVVLKSKADLLEARKAKKSL